MIKKAILISVFFIFSVNSYSQEYKNWEEHEVVRFYAKKEIQLDYDSLDENGDDLSSSTIVVYEPTKVENGTYAVEVTDRVSSRLWNIRGTDIYIYFRFNPFLYNWDEGVLEVYYSSGTFYKQP